LIEYDQTEGFCRGNALESEHWMVLHRPFEPARHIGG
jgi:hypothetical protein